MHVSIGLCNPVSLLRNSLVKMFLWRKNNCWRCHFLQGLCCIGGKFNPLPYFLANVFLPITKERLKHESITIETKTFPQVYRNTSGKL
jgi:hypothetical protein